MASNNKVQMPSSGGGLVRYFEDVKTKIPIKPEYVVIAIVVVLIAEIILHRI
ncbi:MAG: preprotein translocase subunit Sec61beta [archaeon]